MPVKCPGCGYENADEALSCNLCQRVLRKEKPAAPPPAAGEPKALDSLEAVKALVQAAMQAAGERKTSETSRMMKRVFLEMAVGDGKQILLTAGDIWIQSLGMDEAQAALARGMIKLAAEAAGKESYDGAFKILQPLVARTGADPRQNPTLPLLVIGLQAAAGAGAPGGGEDREAQFKTLLDEGIRDLMTPGKQEHGVSCLEKARAMIPDPPRTPQDQARRERIGALLESFRKDSVSAPAAKPAPEAAGLAAKAREAVQRGDTAGALACFERLTQLDPKDARSWGHRGVCLHQLGRFEDALASYQKAAELKPEDASAWLNQALCHQELKRGAEALACCEKALGLTPLSPNAWYTKGSILLELPGRGHEAAVCFDEVLGLKPDFHWALYKKALALDGSGQAAPALAAFEKFLGAAPPAMGAQIEAARRRSEELRKAG